MSANNIITSDIFNSNAIEIRNDLDYTHLGLTDLISKANSLYNQSSVYEDIILGNFLTTYNLTKSITGGYKSSSTIFESFTSLDNYDRDFHVDETLNVDIQNGDLTLGIKQTVPVDIVSVIIEDDSNGDIGSSTGTQKYDNINSILSASSSSLFIYEKIVNTFSASPLYLSLTLKTDSVDIINGVYIRLYTEDNAPYPILDFLSISEDGQTWTDITIDSININKADYYIRFLPKKARYIRAKFYQNTYGIINTNFGIRYRYIIGIREMSVKKTEYNTKGEYVSIQFADKKNINEVLFSKTDKANNDIKYFLSGNNGSKWIELENNKRLKLTNDLLGLREETTISSIRVKIEMDKSDIALGYTSTSETLLLSSSGQYTLKNKPLNTELYYGNHISYGSSTPYSIQVTSNASDNSSILSGSTRSFILNYIPYYSTMKDDIVIQLDGVDINTASYAFFEDIYPENSILKFSSTDIKQGTISLWFKPVIFNPSIDTSLYNVFTLPYPVFSDGEGAIAVVCMDQEDNILYNLEAGAFKLESDTELYIEPSFYNTDYKYAVIYYPAIKVNTYINIENNIATIQGIRNTSALMPMLKFKYNYRIYDDSNIMNFYTPICNEYSLELI